MEQQDWQVNKTQPECGKYMLENQVNTDVNFRVGEDQRTIRAHKVVLSMRSPVFDRMFNGSFKEAAEDPVIPDISPDAFNIILRYCYYDCLDVPYEMAISTLYAAKKYILPILENHARGVLIQKLGILNIWDIFEHSVDIGDEKLQMGCKKYFKDDVATVREALHVSNFLTVSHNALLALLHMNDISDNAGATQTTSENHILGICIAEVELFHACNNWAEAECLRQAIDLTGPNKRTVLGECLFLIRFPTMLYEDLVNEVYPAGIFTEIEKDNLCRYKHCKKADFNCQVEFPTAERLFLPGFVDPESAPRSDDSNYTNADSTIFMESKERVLLTKLWVKSSCLPETVTVKDETSIRSVTMKAAVQSQTYMVKGVESPLLCVHIEPMVLNAGCKYSIAVRANWKGKVASDSRSDDSSIGPFTFIKQVSISRCFGARGTCWTCGVDRPTGFGSVSENKYTYLKALTFSLV